MHARVLRFESWLASMSAGSHLHHEGRRPTTSLGPPPPAAGPGSSACAVRGAQVLLRLPDVHNQDWRHPYFFETGASRGPPLRARAPRTARADAARRRGRSSSSTTRARTARRHSRTPRSSGATTRTAPPCPTTLSEDDDDDDDDDDDPNGGNGGGYTHCLGSYLGDCPGAVSYMYDGASCILVSIIVDKYAGCRQDNSELR